MSDADNQMGGEGGDTGKDPDDKDSRETTVPDADEQVDSESDESFPASDPPANY